ncbi:MAG: efflux RND transporter periplasmic adaptor subunit [Puniceicoccaceae bacterium]
MNVKNLLGFIAKISLLTVVVGLVAVYAAQNLKSEATVATVTRGVAIDAVPAILTVEPEFDLLITSDVGGRIHSSNLDLGTEVKAGDILVKIDETDLRLSYEQFKVDFNAMNERMQKRQAEESEKKRREEDLETAERRYAEGQLSKLEIERRREDFLLYKEQLELKRIAEDQSLESARIELKKYVRLLNQTEVLAPSDGIVEKIHAWPGELINKGTAIATLYSNNLLIKAKVNEENFAGIKIGQPAQIRFLAYGNRTFPGKVSKVLPSIDSNTQQYTVYLELDRGNQDLENGLTGEASIIKNRREDSLIIPRRALMGEGYVFVVKGDVVEQRAVTVGFRALNVVQITEGLQEGEVVISDELERFRDGDKIRVINSLDRL